MAYEQERANIEAVADKHSHVPVIPEFSAPVARLILRRCATLKISPPLVVRRFQDRAEGPKGQNGAVDKIGRDFYGKEYSDLTPDKRAEVDSLHSALGNHNPATGHPYLKPGLTFAQARHLLIETYKTEANEHYPQEIRTALADFRTGLEKDLDESAKAHGFYQEYSKANQALRIATAGPHRAGQTIPMITVRR
jgi:hypothetical protein